MQKKSYKRTLSTKIVSFILSLALIVTYEGYQDRKSEKLNARAYLCYTDANGKVRYFYNDYRKNMYNGGCLCSYNQARQLLNEMEEAQQQEQPTE